MDTHTVLNPPWCVKTYELDFVRRCAFQDIRERNPCCSYSESPSLSFCLCTLPVDQTVRAVVYLLCIHQQRRLEGLVDSSADGTSMKLICTGTLGRHAWPPCTVAIFLCVKKSQLSPVCLSHSTVTPTAQHKCGWAANISQHCKRLKEHLLCANTFYVPAPILLHLLLHH